jgi:predicted double-glycine peptidase
MIAAAGAAVALLASPAAAQVRLTSETSGGNYRVHVMSWWEIPFRSVVRQAYDFSCGSAALATLLSYHYHAPTPERAVFRQMWLDGDQPKIRKVGFSLFEMKNYLTSRGYKAEGFTLKPGDLAKVRRPVIALIELRGFKHFVVIKGVRDGRVLVGDPVLGLTQYSLAHFAKMWNGIVLAVMATPERRRPDYDLATDWGPWSKAPMEGGMTRVAVADLTSDLPPAYQITPQLLLDVRVGTVK